MTTLEKAPEPVIGNAVPLGLRKRSPWEKVPWAWVWVWVWAILIFVSVSLIRLETLHFLAKERVKTAVSQLDRWDAVHYIGIARGGYLESGPGVAANVHETRMAFFPAFPFSMRLVHEITGLDYLQAGILVNFFAGTAMVAAVLCIAKHMGAPLWGRLAAGVLVAGAPMGLTFNMPYTEAMFAAFAYWALWAMLEKRWWLAGIMVFFTGLTRVTALDLFIVFFFVVLVYGRSNWRAWLSLSLSPAGMLAYLAFVNEHTKDVGGYFGLQQKGWNSSFDYGASSLKFLRWAFTGTSDSWIVLVGAFMLFSAFCIIVTFGSTPWPVWLFSAGITANILLSDGVTTARPRLLLPAVICMIPMAIALGKRELGDAGVAEKAVPTIDRPAVHAIAFYGRWLLIAISWTIFGAIFSAHPLLATKWAI